MVKSYELVGAFLGAVGKLGISLDYILLGEGDPFSEEPRPQKDLENHCGGV